MRIKKEQIILFKKVLIVILQMGVESCLPKTEDLKKDAKEVQTTYSELYRPQYHFTTKKNWINDPNGLIKHNGLYHLYYQYNPFGSQWGHMSWGHATSKDLVHWEEQEVAIPEDEYMIFSGTTAVDPDNKSGFFRDENGIISAYTSFEFEYKDNGEIREIAQHQSIATSKDNGFSYQNIPQNPVLDIKSKNFRDPKIFFDERTQKWNMLVSLADKHSILFYQSEDLLSWSEVSRFGPLGNTDAVWECPDLFQLNVRDSEETKWVLTLSAGHPQEGFLGMQYFIGEFDGERFIADEMDYPLYLDYGKDFYAGITYANTGTKEHAMMLGWLGCHIYSKDTPTDIWRGAMSLPRNLFLVISDKGLRVKSEPPLRYLKPFIEKQWQQQPMGLHDGMITVPLKTKAFLARAIFQNKGGQVAGLKVLQSKDHETIIGIDFTKNEVFIDRRNSGDVGFNERFPSKDSVPIELQDNQATLDIFVDHSVIEVFVQDGEQVLTSLVFPEASGDSIKIFAEGGETQLKNVEIRTLKSIWP